MIRFPKYIEAPNGYWEFMDIYNGTFEYPSCDDCLFLAGSITGAWDWQKVAAERLGDKYHILNPRRADFNVNDPSVEQQQIEWEHEHLEYAHNLLFYFSHETLAPITLFEYGCYLNSHKNLFVCVDPKYKRKNDVIIQTKLRNPNVTIHFDFDKFLDTIK